MKMLHPISPKFYRVHIRIHIDNRNFSERIHIDNRNFSVEGGGWMMDDGGWRVEGGRWMMDDG
ncbi:MAG: hypothetical protein KIH03_02855 [Paludibacteraceae bacterium]|nr:hypothetical protein [Paludibacteraceae bacterium]